MKPKTIILNVTETESKDAHVQHALDLAKATDAHVMGVVLVPDYIFPAITMADVPVQVMDAQRERAREVAALTTAAFVEAATAAGISHSTEEITGSGDGLPGNFSRIARTGDLTVVGQRNPDKEEALSTAVIEATLFGSGRPMLIVPYIGVRGGPMPRHAIVAWDGSATAARAAFDAVPLLTGASEVEVIAVHHGQHLGDIEAGGKALAAALVRHGVKTRFHTIPSGGTEVANALLSHASDSGSDLLVMGGYGHSRLREFMLGGATREILSSMTVPVLMAH